MKKERVFTPTDPKGLTGLPLDDMERVRMSISEVDGAKIGGRTWRATVTDLKTGRRWRVRDAPCGASCRCAATITSEELNAARERR